MPVRLHFRSVAFLHLFLLIATHAFAQSSATGSVRGRVLDPSHAVVPKAIVTLTNRETGLSQSATTDGGGYFAFPRVIPGRYTLAGEHQGFGPALRDDVAVAVNETVVSDLLLSLDGLTEAVDVRGRGSDIQTQTVEISSLIDERRVRELPLNGKNFQRLLFLTPGVGGGAGGGSNPSIGGARLANNNYTIDGLTLNNERLSTGIVGVNGAGSDFLTDLPNIVSTEAIQEFRVISANADATFGRGSGGQISIITKSGTNTLRGSGYEFRRDDRLDARDFFNHGPFFDDEGRAVVPPFKQDLFGGTLGGPIARNRHFFFVNYEGLRQERREQSAVSTIVPNADLITLVPGDLGRFFRTFYFDREIVPRSGNPAGAFSPLAAAERAPALAAGFPAHLFDGDAENGEAGTVLISAAPRRDTRQDGFMVRTDHQLTDGFGASLRYSFADSLTLTGNSAIGSDRSQSDKRYQSALAQFTYTLTPTQVIEARLGVLRNKFESQVQGGIDQRFKDLGISDSYGLFVRISNFAVTAGTGGSFIDNQTTPQAAVTHHWSRGALTVRSGIDARLLHVNVANISSGQPAFVFTNFVGPNGILGAGPGQPEAIATTASLAAYGFAGGPTTPMRGYRSSQHELFSQADWRIRPDVTLNLGVRYSVFGVYGERHGAVSNLYSLDPTGQIVVDRETYATGPSATAIQPIGLTAPFYQPDRNNVQPRIGVAWNVGGQGATVIRAGYGVFQDRLIQIQFTGVVTNPPFAAASAAANVPFRLDAPVPLSLAAFPAFTAVNPEVRNPWTDRYNVAVERRVGSRSSIMVGYIGAHGHDLFAWTQPNGGGGVPQTLRPDPRFSTVTYVDNLASSTYHSMQALGKRNQPGLDLTVAYTLGRSRDHVSGESFRTLHTIRNRGADPASGFQGGGPLFERIAQAYEWADSDFDVRHHLSLSALVELPFGPDRRFLKTATGLIGALVSNWTIAALGTWRTGEPLTVILGRDANDDGDAFNDRPSLASGTLSDLYANGGSAPTQYLVPAAEAVSKLVVSPAVTDPFRSIARNALRSLSMHFVDLSLMKHVPLRGRARLAVEMNAFNVFNRLNFGAPIANLSDPRFGLITASRAGTNPRQIQLGAKLSF